MEHYSAIKQNEIMPFATTWMDLRDYHTSKSEGETQTQYDITCMWNLKYDKNKPIYKTETDSQAHKTDLWLSRGRQGRREMN